MSKMIKDYLQESEFVNAGAGTSTWCKASKGDKKYFIKSFLEVTLLDEHTAEKLPAGMVEAKQKSCIQFRIRKERLYKKLNEIQNGIFISPIELLVHNGHFCAVTDYIESFSESDQVFKFSPRRRIILMRTMVAAMRDLSSNHIVHSDIKPDNIIITYNKDKQPQLKIIDFDSGFFEDSPPHNVNEYHGDMVYFAPESMIFMQSEGESDVRLTCAVDKFAVGLLLHKMWCGELPRYDTEECLNAAEALLLEKSIDFNTSIPKELATVINGFLKLEPDQRMSYDDAYNILGELLKQYSDEDSDNKDPVPPKTADVKVILVDNNGNVLQENTLKITAGTRVVVVPKILKGYECLDSKCEISVDKQGRAKPNSIKFRYKRKEKSNSALEWIAICILACILVWTILAVNAKAEFEIETTGEYGVLDEYDEPNGFCEESYTSMGSYDFANQFDDLTGHENITDDISESEGE